MSDDWEGLLDSPESIKNKRKIRVKSEIVKKVDNGEEGEWEKNGYVIIPSRSNGRTTVLSYQKKQDEIFEDKVWLCLSNLNFKYMSGNRNFKIKYSDDPNVKPQQIDVFAADDDVAIVVECKSTEVYDRRTQFKDQILTLSAQKELITNEIKSHFNNSSMAVSFVFITNNYSISDSDKSEANRVNVILLTGDDIDYYNSLHKNIGSAAKYHLLADIFEKQPISSLKTSVPAIKGSYKNVTMYAFLIEPAYLLPISFVAHRTKNSKSAGTTYQRMIKKVRIEKIKKFIENESGFFPSSIIINIDSDSLEFTEKEKHGDNIVAGVLTLPNQYKSAWIIDGQHRLFSYCGTDEATSSFIPVVAFEKLSYRAQSEMFMDINSKQTKVDKNLLLEISSESHWDSDKPEEWLDALITKCILDMSKDPVDPLYMRLKSSTEDTGGDITITTLVGVISKTSLFGQMVGGQLQYGPLSYTKDEGDIKKKSFERGKFILTGYFRYFSQISGDHWKRKGGKFGGYLCTNNGLTALIIVLRDILKYISEHCKDVKSLSEKDVVENIRPYATALAEFFRDNDGGEIIGQYRGQLGAHGQQQSAMDMEVVINLAIPEFTSPDLERHKEKTKKQWEDRTIEIFPTINSLVISTMVDALKEKYGDKTSGWWKKGIPDEIRSEIGSIREADEEEKCYEDYITLKHVIAIVGSKDWELFKKYFGFAHNGRKREEQIQWLSELSRIERIINEKKRITQDEYDSVYSIKKTFENNLTNAVHSEIKSNDSVGGDE